MPILSGLLANDTRANRTYVLTIDKPLLITKFNLGNDIFWGDSNNWKEVLFYYSKDDQVKIISFSKATTKFKMPRNAYNGLFECTQIVITDGLGRAKIYGRDLFGINDSEFDFVLLGGLSLTPTIGSDTHIEALLSSVYRVFDDKNNPNVLWMGIDGGTNIVDTFIQGQALTMNTETGSPDTLSGFLKDSNIQRWSFNADGTKIYVIGAFNTKFRNITLPAPVQSYYLRVLEIDTATGAVTYLFDVPHQSAFSIHEHGDDLIIHYLYSASIYGTGTYLARFSKTGVMAWRVENLIHAAPFNYNENAAVKVILVGDYIYTSASRFDAGWTPIFSGTRSGMIRFDALTGVSDSTYKDAWPADQNMTGMWSVDSEGTAYGWSNITSTPYLMIWKSDGTGSFLTTQGGAYILDPVTSEDNYCYFFYYPDYSLRRVNKNSLTMEIFLTDIELTARGGVGFYGVIYGNPLATHADHIYMLIGGSYRRINLTTKVLDMAFWGEGVANVSYHSKFKNEWAVLRSSNPTYNYLYTLKGATSISGRHIVKFDVEQKKYLGKIPVGSVYDPEAFFTSSFVPNKMLHIYSQAISAWDTSNDEVIPYPQDPINYWPRIDSQTGQTFGSAIVDGQFAYVAFTTGNPVMNLADFQGSFPCGAMARCDLTTRLWDRTFIPAIPAVGSTVVRYGVSKTIAYLYGSVEAVATANYIYMITFESYNAYAGPSQAAIYRIKKSDMTVQDITELIFPVSSVNKYPYFSEANNGNIFVRYSEGTNPTTYDGKFYRVLKESDLSFVQAYEPITPTPSDEVLVLNGLSNGTYFKYDKDDNALFGLMAVMGNTLKTGFCKIDVATNEITFFAFYQNNNTGITHNIDLLPFKTLFIKLNGDTYTAMAGKLDNKALSGIVKMSSFGILI